MNKIWANRLIAGTQVWDSVPDYRKNGVILKTLLGIESQHFNFRHPLEDSHQGIDPAADGFRRVDGEVGRFYTEKHQLSMTGEQSILCDFLDINQLPTGLPLLCGIFLFPAHCSFTSLRCASPSHRSAAAGRKTGAHNG